MKAKDFVYATKLLQNENNENKCSIEKIEHVFNLVGNYYWHSEKNNIDRSYWDTLNKIVECQNKMEIFEQRVRDVFASKKVKDWQFDNLLWRSGYAMGEVVKVIVTDGIATKCSTIMDTRQTYSGRGAKYNDNIVYGEKTLICDVSKKRTKYTERIKNKIL